ncbi:TfoX/Sxy family protein [Pseudomonas sp. Marseille-QA0892]
MATDSDFVEYVKEQAGLGSRLTSRKMFGEYTLYLDEKVVAVACDNSVFIKPSPALAALAPDLPRRPPYPRAKDYALADELLDDTTALRKLITETAAHMPAAKRGKSRKA